MDSLPGSEAWRMGNISSLAIGAATPQQLLGRLVSLTPDAETKMVDADKVKAYTDANPEVLLQGKYFASQSEPTSFSKVNYRGVHAFGFTDAAKQ